MPRLDTELQLLLERKAYYEKNTEEARRSPSSVPDPKEVLNISVKFKGNIDQLKETGFQPGSVIGEIAFGIITLENLEKLVANPDVLTIEKQRRKTIHLKDSIPDIHADQVWSRSGDTFSNITGKDVIVGIVDTGINFRHESFQHPDGTSRILRIWDQTLTATGTETAPAAITDAAIGSVPLGYGVEYNQAQINGTLQNANLPVTVRHEDKNGHGTHVAGISAGNGRQGGNCHGGYTYIGAAPEADIIMVRLWGLTTGDTNAPSTTTGTMIDAISYILNTAKHIINKPVVINLSLGTYTEKMDGSSNECQTMNSLLTNAANDEGFAIVFAAGNEADSNFHAKATVPAGPAATLGIRFKILPGDSKDRYIAIVYSGSNLRVRVTSPVSGAPGVVGWVASGASATSNTANGTGGPSVTITNGANSITIGVLHATGINVAGDWKIELQDTGSTSTAINAFCLYGSSHDSKSHFFLDSTTVQTTLSEESTAAEVITVGAYQVSDGQLASFSGRGLTLDLRLKPEITAPGVSIESAGIDSDLSCKNCCCDCCHDYYVNKSGTSMAAPHITGVVALMLQKNPNLTHINILDKLSSKARPKPGGSTVDEDMGWGAGKVDAKATVDDIAGGGGGVSGPHAPFYKPSYREERIYKEDNLFEHFRRSKRSPELIALFRKYFHEIRILINTNKRVATVWHRSKGPLWIRAAIRAASSPELPIPFKIDGFSLQEGMARMLDILKRYGSSMLINDLNKYEDELMLIKEGMNVYQLMNVFTEPVMCPQ